MTTNELRKEFERIKLTRNNKSHSPGYAGQQFKLLEIEMELKRLELLGNINGHLGSISEHLGAIARTTGSNSFGDEYQF